ncbi:hypothetical protein PR003_g28226 [Phytophthora rubi]|uniref:Uncharacterized protein n=1 Tax=Phytophthora rubi TaxID=129364 RepID=A0A6A4BVV0_9STRA|nr:hypothetical protein PR003_g28226 [Phytophthora rubi]
MIICRRLPQFFNRIMLTEDKLMIIGIVRAQVERLLIMDLDGELPVKEAFQSTKSLQESISIATMNRNTDHQQLWGLLAAVKTISYNAAKHEIHFYFFTREAASRFDGLEAPFHRATHRLVNAQHAGRRAPGANVWELQYEEDGALISTASEYVVILRNVTHILDLGRLHAFLKHVLRVPFVFEDLAQSSLNRSSKRAATSDPEPKHQGGPRDEEPKEGWFDGRFKKKPSSGIPTNHPQANFPIQQGSVPAKNADKPTKPGMKNGRVNGAHQNAKAGSRFNPLTIESANEKSSQEDEQKPEQPEKPKPTAKTIRKAHAELLVAEDTALADLAAALAPAPTTQAQDPVSPAASAAIHGVVALEKSLSRALVSMGLRPVSTPRSGNCQVYSVAQALANCSFSDTLNLLAQADTALKKGCTARAFIDFPLKYPHGQRKQTLLQLRRGCEKMTQPVSKEEFRRYLTEYGSSSSDPAVFLPGKLWGSNDTLATYGTMLQRDILVISFVPGKST